MMPRIPASARAANRNRSVSSIPELKNLNRVGPYTVHKTLNENHDKLAVEVSEAVKKYKPNIFERNIGKVILSVIGVIAGLIHRSGKGNDRFLEQRDLILDARAISPQEINELRRQNKLRWALCSFRPRRES
jgi:hypothetical protein